MTDALETRARQLILCVWVWVRMCVYSAASPVCLCGRHRKVNQSSGYPLCSTVTKKDKWWAQYGLYLFKFKDKIHPASVNTVKMQPLGMSLTAFMLCFCWLVCVFFLVLMWSWPNVIMEGEVQQLQIILKWSNSNINSKDKEKDLGHAQTDVYTVSKYHCWIVQQKRRACYCFTIITLEGTIISTLKFCLILRTSLQLFRLNISQTKLSSLYLILGTCGEPTWTLPF